MSRQAIGVIILAAGLTGCTGAATDPYYLGRWVPGDMSKMEIGLGEPMNDPRTGRPYFSVCYNRLTHTAEQVRSLVRKHCGDPELTLNRTDLYSCSLAAPARVTYSCSALSRTAEEARPNLLRSDSSLGTIDLN